MKLPELELSRPQHLGLYDPYEFFDNQVLTINEAARLLKFSPKTLYKLVREKKIPFKKVGTQFRFLHQQLTDWMKEGE